MRHSAGGFSLLEILVAFSIMALALGVIMRVFSGSLNNVSTSQHYATAVLIAESKMASAGIELPLVEGETSGDTSAGYHWQVQIHREDDTSVATDMSPGLDLYRVEVRVEWPSSPDRKARIRLVSLRVGAAK